MRYIKVLLLVVLLFLVLVFLFQNQTSLSQSMTLTLNLFFVPPMASIPLPFYFIVIVAFFLGAILSLSFLVWDKIHLSARVLKDKWRIGSLEREVARLKKTVTASGGAETCTGKDGKAPKSGSGHPEDVAAPDPDKG
jgi:ATP adenylyltransferase